MRRERSKGCSRALTLETATFNRVFRLPESVPKIEVYGSTSDETTAKMRAFLDEKGVFYVFLDVDRLRDGRREMIVRGGKSRLPQVFINDRPIGSWDDLKELDEKGDLWEWLVAGRHEGAALPGDRGRL